MDAKDLRTEAALGNRSNDGKSQYPQASVLQANKNKTYHDIGSNSLANKVEGQAARPCAVIGPDRVVPPPAPVDACLKKASVEPWPGLDPTYRKPPDYPNKLPDYTHPSRNISPRQTFQENMQRFMLPLYNSAKPKEDHNFPVDANISSQRNKLSGSTEGKYCEVPYTVSPLASEHKNMRSADISVSNNIPTEPKSAPHGWLPSSANRPVKPYSVEVYQYPEYQNCAGPRPVLMPRPHRTLHEESGHMYNESYYPDARLRYKPYPAVKERYPQARYDYGGNYSNPFHPPPPFASHKYDVQKQLPPHPYSGYTQVPLKYMDTRMSDPTMNSYQRPINTQMNFNSVAYRNQMIHPQFGPVPGNYLQPNKFYPYPLDKSVTVNKPPYDPTNHKNFGEYESGRGKPYNMPETYYVNEMMRHHPLKATQAMPPNYPTVGMQGIPPHPYYRKENPTITNYEMNPHYRNFDPSINLSASMLSRLPTQFSPNAIAISPSVSNTSNDTTHSLGTSQEDCGYVSQSSSASIHSADSALNRLHGDFYRRYDHRYGSMVRSLPIKTNENSDSCLESKNKKNIDLRQYLQMWNEGEDENNESNNKEISVSSSSNPHENININGNTNQEQLYVLGLVNVSSEELSKYEHIQKVSKLPENIKGYNSIELLNQFEEVIESSNLNKYSEKPPMSRSFQISSLKSTAMQNIGIPSRPLSPLDVEAKISQSVIHKDVGCNFEIKPCSPKMLNVEVATPAQNVIGERVIEKLNNLVSAPTPVVPRVNDDVSDYEIIKHQDHRITLNDNKASSCKMNNSSHYTSTENSNSVKSNYSLQDLESNSGVCLASLPRLDNDIELTFPEVNQQFINANKVESVITQNTTQKDLPPLDIEQSEILQEIDLKNISPVVEHEKEFYKLSKYRKRRRNSECKEDKELIIQSIRTDSVIIKNPENDKCLEKSTNYVANNNTQDAQKDPINLSVYSDPSGHLSKSMDSGNDNNTNTSKNTINSSIEIDSEGSCSDNYPKITPEFSDEKKSVVVPDSSKSKNYNMCVLETSDTDRIDVDNNADNSKESSPIENYETVNDNQSDNKKVFNCGVVLNSEQNIIQDSSDVEHSSLNYGNKQTEDSDSCQLSDCDLHNKFNLSDVKVSLTLGADVNELETSSTNHEDQPADQGLLVDNARVNRTLKIEEEYPDITNNERRPEIKTVTVCKQQSDKISEISFVSNMGQAHHKECTRKKVHKELFSPRIQNLIVFIEGTPKNLLKESDSATVFNASIQQGSTEIKLCDTKSYTDAHISSNQFDVGSLENQRSFDKSVKATEITQEECLNGKFENKPKTVSWDILSNSDQHLSAQTEKNIQPVWKEFAYSVKSALDFNDDNRETLSISNITDIDTCDNQREITLNLEERNVSSPQNRKDISLDLNKTVLISTYCEKLKENATAESAPSKLTPAIIKLCTNDENVDWSTESFEKIPFDSFVDKDSELSSETDILMESKDKCNSYDKINTNISINKDKIKEKNFISIQMDQCGQNQSKKESVQGYEKNTLSDINDSLPVQCKSLNHLDKIDDDKHCTSANSHTSVVKNSSFKEKENQVSVPEVNSENHLNHIKSKHNKDKGSKDLLCEKTTSLDNLHQELNFVVSKEKENSSKSFHCASEPSEGIDHRSKSCKETVKILQDLCPDVQKTYELTYKELANLNYTKPKFISTNNANWKNKTLKRSLSDSAINACSQEDLGSIFFLNKKRKIYEPENLQPHIITENYCNIAQNNRRNSLSSVYNEDNVSFCILIDNNCILTEDCEESDKFCYTGIPEHCLSCIESENDNEIVDEDIGLISVQGEVNYDQSENFDFNKDTNVVFEQDLQETWVEDIACVETVVSDEVAEDIVESNSTSPKELHMSDDDTDIFNTNEHRDKVKHIYGDKMCTDDTHLVETFYRTPQMDVNKTLINIGSQGIDDCHRYYDDEALEKLLSESTNLQADTGCSLSALSPPNLPFANSDTGLCEKTDLDLDEDSISLLKNSTALTKLEGIENTCLKTQDDTVHSCETSVDDVLSFDQVEESLKRTKSSSPEVSSTTSEERNSGILLKITNFSGARVAKVDSSEANKSVNNVSCKYTENKDYAKPHNSLLPSRPLLTKAAQKYIPPLKETIHDLKIKLPLPQHSLFKLKELKISKEEPKLSNCINKHKTPNSLTKENPKKAKPKFEDVLKSIDELQLKMHKEKIKKHKKIIPKVVIKKNENGSHYTSTLDKEKYNPDLTGRKWQPWVFIEKNNLIDKMALKKKTKAVFSHRKNTFILAETFKKYKSITNAQFVISQPTSQSVTGTGQLKYTIRLKQSS